MKYLSSKLRLLSRAQTHSVRRDYSGLEMNFTIAPIHLSRHNPSEAAYE
jgi:hypothetical protein